MPDTPTIYTSETCRDCQSTKRAFESRGVAVLEIDVNKTPGAVPALKSMGYQQLPVVITKDDRWSGYRIDKILGHVSKVTRHAS